MSPNTFKRNSLAAGRFFSRDYYDQAEIVTSLNHAGGLGQTNHEILDLRAKN
jgi:hypothetical protein